LNQFSCFELVSKLKRFRLLSKGKSESISFVAILPDPRFPHCFMGGANSSVLSIQIMFWQPHMYCVIPRTSHSLANVGHLKDK